MAIQYNSNYEGTTPFSDVCKQFNLAANTEQTYTVPGTATTQYQAHFTYISTAAFFVCLNGTAASPAGGTNTAVPYNVFRPCKKYVRGGDVIHLVSPDAVTYVGLELMQLQG